MLSGSPLSADRSNASSARENLAAGLASSRPILSGSALAAAELLAGLLGLRHERVVDQQHHALVRVLLERRGQQGVADNALVLLVGRDDRGQRRRRRVEEMVEDGAASPVMGAGPVEEAESAQQLGEGGDGQQGDDEQVENRLGPVDRGFVARVEKILGEPCDEVAEPRRHRDDDGQAAHGDPAVADWRGDDGHRPGAPVAAPLPASSARGAWVRGIAGMLRCGSGGPWACRYSIAEAGQSVRGGEE